VTIGLALPLVGAGKEKPVEYDVVITGGMIIDGSGSPWYRGDVAIKDGKIADVGRILNPSAKRTIRANGMVLAPGFIDLHSHSDFDLLVDGSAQSKIRQGVTTEIIGEASSAGPVVDKAAEEFDKALAPTGIHRDWTTLGQYFDRLQRQGISVNIASYVGSGLVREDVVGNVNRPITAAELKQMEDLVGHAMRDGAIGLSSGLIYPPNSYMSTEELSDLATVAANYGGIYTTHIRGEGADAIAALTEAIQIGKDANLPVHILHFKAYGKQNWGTMHQLVDLIDSERALGSDITADQYPYIASMTDLHMCLPPKYLEGTSAEIVARLQDPAAREEIRKDIEEGLPRWENEVRSVDGWHGVMVASVQKPENKGFEGKRMDEVAKMMGKDPVDALCDLLISENGSAGAVYFGIDEPDVELAMKQPWVGFGSDGSAVNPEMTFVGRPHPRFYGTFPRVLGYYVRQKKVITLPDAIRKMTSLPAQITGLNDRGLLRPGMAADVVVFNPNSVADRATFEDPLQYPVGIPYVVVNGQVVIDNSKHTGAKPGRVLYGRGKGLPALSPR
jgi:dihydroorotase/N-acyl-D-amino-acid deacylase